MRGTCRPKYGIGPLECEHAWLRPLFSVILQRASDIAKVARRGLQDHEPARRMHTDSSSAQTLFYRPVSDSVSAITPLARLGRKSYASCDIQVTRERATGRLSLQERIVRLVLKSLGPALSITATSGTVCFCPVIDLVTLSFVRSDCGSE